MIFPKIFNNLTTLIKHYYYLYLIQPHIKDYNILLQSNHSLVKEIEQLKNKNNVLEKTSNQLFIKNESLEENNYSLNYENEKLETKVIDLQKENQLINFQIKNMNHNKVQINHLRRELQSENEELQKKLNTYKKLFENKTSKKSDKKISLSGINNPKYGNGAIRYIENGKYYHGVGKNETGQKWNRNNIYNHCIFEYIKGHRLIHPDLWDTYNANDFCSNCSYNYDLSKRKRVMSIYQCNGHEI